MTEFILAAFVVFAAVLALLLYAAFRAGEDSAARNFTRDYEALIDDLRMELARARQEGYRQKIIAERREKEVERLSALNGDLWSIVEQRDTWPAELARHTPTVVSAVGPWQEATVEVTT